jgi:uncharacterized protein (TIGR03083 family)
MDDEPMPKTKAELLELIAQERSALEQVIAQLSEAQLTTPHPESGWSVKDHLAHIVMWERSITALLQYQPRWEAMGLDTATVRASSIDQTNDTLYRMHKDRPLSEVMAMFHDSHRHTLEVLNSLDDEALFKSYAHYQPNEQRDDRDAPIINWIAGDTYAHYAEHRKWIGEQVGKG